MDEPNETSNEKEKLNQVKSTNILKNLKSDYILQKIFDNLKKMKLLIILKYNKYNQQRLNLTINLYKGYCELLTQIVIEIIPSKEPREKYGFGYEENVINYDDKYKKYYHIYFNNNTEEVKRNYLSR